LIARQSAHQCRCRLRLGQHHDVLNAGVLQRLPQLIGSALIGPAQPGGDQSVILVCQRAICTDHRLRQTRDRILGEDDDRLVNHAMAVGSRFDEGQAGNRTGDCDA
jgi:small ligand-binding sensory domain FIST